MNKSTSDYLIRIVDQPHEVDSSQWDRLLAIQPAPTPFMQWAYLEALHTSGSANASTGWEPKFILLERNNVLCGACVVYIKNHSYGEYVFDWSWANAYQQHGLNYYPKAASCVPFTPVPGTRLMADSDQHRALLAKALPRWCSTLNLSSFHLLFGDDSDIKACESAGMMVRHTVQFHWHNQGSGFLDFDQFLATLSQEKRKKIKQERKKVSRAGVEFRFSTGSSITSEDWDFFYKCYSQTYLEHGNAPYLSKSFFQTMAIDMSNNWLLFIAEKQGRPIASSLIGLGLPNSINTSNKGIHEGVAYGRYWGAIERVDCLHFEACYYQPLQWCIANGYRRFEGGAQGEHKMARALMPVKTSSAHWLANPEFSDAVENFLEKEGEGIGHYMEHLEDRTPFKSTTKST